MNDLDRILQDDHVIQPSSGFAARVMERVRAEAAAPAPIEFPWRRFLPGAISVAALLLIAVMLALASFGTTPDAGEAAAAELPAWVSPALLQEPGAIAVVAVAASLALAWAAVRLTVGTGKPSF